MNNEGVTNAAAHASLTGSFQSAAQKPEPGPQSNVGPELPSSATRGITMRKTLTVLAAAATITIATVATAPQAEARFRAGPFFGGLAAGAIIGGALAGPSW